MEPGPRYVPEIPFPAYAFVPGRHPHPIRDPEGHSFDAKDEHIAAPALEKLTVDSHFRFGLDLFNFGYYWEAHEAWEGLWLAAGRRGRLADLLKGLIHLAAAGVKAREGNKNGVIRHAERACELLALTRAARLEPIAKGIAANPDCDDGFTIEGCPVLGIRLCLEDFADLSA